MTADVTFDLDRLLDTAAREAGLEDFGPSDYLEGLGVLAETYHRAPLTARGVRTLEKYLLHHLGTRLQVADLLRHDPSIERRSIDDPIYIIGLARTGTTLLHQLLSVSGDTRPLLHWEARRPAPIPFPEGEEDPRIGAARAELDGFEQSPMAAIHYVAADLPEEDYLLVQPSMRIGSPSAGLWQPYADWSATVDQRPGYAYLATLVRVLDAQRPGGRWLMKSPIHLPNLDLLVEQFPDVRFVWTHRDPVVAISSLCSLIATVTAPVASVDPTAIGATMTEGCCTHLERALEIRERLGEDRFVDVHYDNLITDPAAVAEDIAVPLGLGPTVDVRAALAAFANANPQHSHGTHRYTAADFGLDGAAIRDRLAPYYLRFMVSSTGGPRGCD